MSKSDALARREAGRDAVLQALAGQVPYNRFLGVEFDRLGDELTARLPYKEPLIGNPLSIASLINALPGEGEPATRMSMLELLPPPLDSPVPVDAI